MIKNIKLIVLLAIGCFTKSMGQTNANQVNLLAYWAKGDVYQFKVTKVKKTSRSGKATTNNTNSYFTRFEVLDSSEKAYKIKWSFKNNWKRDLNVPGAYDEVLAKYYNTEVIYTTNAEGEFTEIENWQAIGNVMAEFFKKFIQFSTDSLNRTVANELKQKMNSLLKVYRSKASIEKLVFKELSYFHFPYGKQYTLKDTIKYDDQLPNLLGGKPLRGHTKIYIDHLHTAKKRLALAHQMTVNPEDAKRFLRSFFKRMKVDETKMNEVLNDARFDIEDDNYLEYDYALGVPRKIKINRRTIFDTGTEQGRRFDKVTIELIEK